MKLAGYSLREPLLPGQENPLVLYLENARPVWLYKVFVHLRDAAGNTVAQADFSPLDQIDEKLRLRMVGQAGSDMVHLTTNLIPPQDLPAGQYSLVIGLYDPTTQQRFPISNDPTGENALILGQVEVR